MRYLDDVLLVVGCGLLVAGACMLSVPAGLMLAGFLCVVAGLVIGFARGGE